MVKVGELHPKNGLQVKFQLVQGSYQLAPLYSDGAGSDFPEFEFEGKKYKPRADTHWKTTVDGLQRLAGKSGLRLWEVSSDIGDTLTISR